MKTNPQLVLRQNVNLLGKSLGETIAHVEGKKEFALVEKIRQLSKKARAGDATAVRKLHALLPSLKNSEKILVVRAFQHFLQLANVAEQQHRVRRKRSYELASRSKSQAPQRYSLEDSFAELKKAKVSKKALYKAVCSLEIDLVLTAHPTEVVRRSILHKYNDVARELSRMDDPRITQWEEIESRAQIDRQVRACWMTHQIRKEKPTPLDEAKWGLGLVEDVLWRAHPRTIKRLTRLLRESTGQELPLDCVPIRFSSWMGGDRDGNPYVTSLMTAEVLKESFGRAHKRLRRSLLALLEELSIKEAPLDFLKGNQLQDSSFPYRDYLGEIIQRVDLNLDAFRSKKDLPADELLKALPHPELLEEKNIIEALKRLHKALCESGAEIIARGRLVDIIRQLQCFGMSLLRLDIRQDESVHRGLLEEIAQQHQLEYPEDEKLRQKFCWQLIESPEKFLPKDSEKLTPSSAELWRTLQTLAALPRSAFYSWIISMAYKPSDILAVWALQALAGMKGSAALPVVPLFETVEALQGARACMKELLSQSAYRKLIGKRQDVMIGYSDSSKRGGRLASAWSLYETQVELSTLFKSAGIDLCFFHGRGGTVGRGGGPTYLAIGAQPKGTLGSRIRVTEQGEVLEAKFGLPGIAMRSLEIYLGSVLRAQVEKDPLGKAPKAWTKLMEELSAQSQQAYKQFIYGQENFEEFFRRVTPEAELSLLNVGSRPKKRKKAAGMDSLRAIPWIFSWTQNRCHLPTWLGVGEALSWAMENGYTGTLRQMYKNWPFFRTTLDLVEMVLAKSDLGVFKFYCKELSDPSLDSLERAVQRKFRQCRSAILAINGQKALLGGNEILRESIKLRNPYTDPINIMQALLLAQYRQKGADSPEELRLALITSINGVAAAMRNTG